jgi:hypothetical protein
MMRNYSSIPETFEKRVDLLCQLYPGTGREKWSTGKNPEGQSYVHLNRLMINAYNFTVSELEAMVATPKEPTLFSPTHPPHQMPVSPKQDKPPYNPVPKTAPFNFGHLHPIYDDFPADC